uniref:ILEI/PANDER domain-containing protein n=1 Tax=Xiphophorus couchianus TaxID=32473 RepID=A0A3B5M3S2_9TELE
MRILKSAALILAFLLAVFLAFQLLEINVEFKLGSVISLPESEAHTKPAVHKCGLSKACPPGHMAFKLTSGAASVVGPRMCLEDKLLMSSVKNNVGRGINIALLNGKTGELIKTAYYDMWAGDICTVLTGCSCFFFMLFLWFFRLNDEARKLIADLGSSAVGNLSFRDNWIFVGGKGIKTKTPFEQHIKNSADTNKYEGWPEVLEMEGCIPQRQT